MKILGMALIITILTFVLDLHYLRQIKLLKYHRAYLLKLIAEKVEEEDMERVLEQLAEIQVNLKKL